MRPLSFFFSGSTGLASHVAGKCRNPRATRTGLTTRNLALTACLRGRGASIFCPETRRHGQRHLTQR